MKKINGVFVIVFLLIGETFGVVYAAYTGPNRSTWVSNVSTYWERKHCSYSAWYDPPGAGYWGCHADNYTCPTCGCPGFSNWTNAACGWPAGASVHGTSSSSGIEGCSSGQSGCTKRTEDNSYWSVQSPAVVSGTNHCVSMGLAGWCKGGATIALTSSDPVYSITGIESSAGMLCTGTSSCTWAYPEGVTYLDFWSLSSRGDTSYMSSTTMNLDTVPPSAGIALSGTTGSGNWFRSAVSVSADGTDDTSGIGTTFIQVGGGPQQASPVTLSAEGTHSVNSIVNDIAGNSAASTSQTFGIDLTNPSYTVELSYAPINTWYKSPLTVSVLGTDTLSGFDRADYTRTDSTGTTTGTLPLTLTTEGTSEIAIVGYDLAGNSLSSTVSYDLDLTLPSVTITSSGATGTVIVSGTASDDRSGLDSVSFSSDNGVSWLPVSVDSGGNWTFNFDTTKFAGGEKKLMAKAVDLAGNLNTSEVSINIANKTAELSMTSYWRVDEAGTLSLIPGDVPVTSITVSICDPSGDMGCSTNTYEPGQLPLEIIWDGRFGSVVAPSGEYDVVAEWVDEQHNTNISTGIILIPDPIPTPQPSATPQTAEPTEVIVVLTESPELEFTEEPTEQAPVVYANETKPIKNLIKQWIEAEVKFKSAPYAILLTFLGVIGLNAVTDPRPKQWDRIGKAIKKNNSINTINTDDNKSEE